MNAPSTRIGLRVISITLVAISFLLTWQQYSLFQKANSVYPDGSAVGEVPISGLTRSEAEKRIRDSYDIPVEFEYQDALIQILPSSLGFSVNLEDMMAEADRQVMERNRLGSFWAYLFGNSLPPFKDLPLQYSFDLLKARQFLQEIAIRYDLPATAPVPVPATTSYSPGSAGYAMDVDSTLSKIETALLSLSNRSVIIPVESVPVPIPIFDNLQIQLQQIIDGTEFGGLTEVYLRDLHDGKTLHFARQSMQNIDPGVAFTAASSIKIPIMISTFARVSEPVPDEIQNNLQKMISVSENEPADWLMQNVLGGNLGPVEVTEDIRNLGLENTFLAGFFFMGAPLLQRIETPANSRVDVNLNPDVYNQTVPKDMGMLLEAIFQCSENGSGLLIDRFAGQITRHECQQMVDLLKSDKLPYLITAGLPEGTPIAHKHGWIEETDGLLHTMSDSALVYSPNESYLLSVYIYHPVNLVFDSGNYLISQLSQAVYNYFNQKQPG